MGEPRAPNGYFEQTRDPLNSFILVLPLLLAYQASLLLFQGKTANGADLTIWLYNAYGVQALYAINGALLAVGVVGVVVTRNKGTFHGRLIAPILAESMLYAILMGLGLVMIVNRLFPNQTGPPASDHFERVFLAIGAGVNEEFVFRLGLFYGGAWLLQQAHVKEGPAVGVALLGSSLLFSAAHYLAEPFELTSFVFRFLAGLFFCGLFQARGFAVAVYTHANYDVLVMVVLPLLFGA